MKCFAFVIHHGCSYRDGMIIVAADDYDHAVRIVNDAKQTDLVRCHETNYGDYMNDPILEKDDEVLDHYPETIDRNQKYNNIWCLYHSFEMAEVEEPGIKGGAYHDG